MVISNTTRDGKACSDIRYFILSKKLSAKNFPTWWQATGHAQERNVQKGWDQKQMTHDRLGR